MKDDGPPETGGGRDGDSFSGATYSAGIALGLLALLSLLGPAGYLPEVPAFFVAALSIPLFAGMMVWILSGADSRLMPTPAERLAVWFAVGAGTLSITGFVTIVLEARLAHVMLVLAVLYACGLVFLLRRRLRYCEEARPVTVRARVSLPILVLLCIAVAAGLLTMLTPRDDDDWYYTAHIADYADQVPIASEDAIFGRDEPADGRSWFGGWWVVEALLARASGVDAVACHQVLLPLLLVPFAVLAVFTLARQLFQSVGWALAGCCLQVLYLVSSAFPHQSAGWMLLCRAGQDKTVASLLMVPVAAALGLILFRLASEKNESGNRGPHISFFIVFVASTVVHPQGIVWSGLALLPLAILELLRLRTRRSAIVLGLIVLAMGVSGAYLVSGKETLDETVDVLQQLNVESRAAPSLGSVYLPGEPLFEAEEVPAGFVAPGADMADAVNPLRVTRYPLAILGLVLTFVLLARVHRSLPARFLVCVTFSVLLLIFIPPGAALSARLMTFRTLYRLTWVLPWGLVIGLALSVFGLRARWAWIVVALITVLLARGNPANYITSLAEESWRSRPPVEVAEALKVLRKEPSPQGWVLTSAETGRFIAGFVPGASPAFYRGEGALRVTELQDLLGRHQPNRGDIDLVRRNRFRYALLDCGLPLAGALRRGWTNSEAIVENRLFTLWRIPDDLELGEPHRPGPNLVFMTVGGMRRDHVGCYGYERSTTPNVDKLARDGIRFGNAVCQSPQTIPSLASIFTGMNPRTHGTIGPAGTLGRRLTTVAELLADTGYLCSAFTGGHALDSCGLEQGFEAYWWVYDDFTLNQVRARYRRAEDPTTEAALSWLERHRESPLFVWVHWPHPGRPYRPPPLYLNTFAPYTGPGPGDGWLQASNVNRRKEPISKADLENLIDRYDGEVAFADAQIGRVLDKLHELGLSDSTIVVVTAAHGEVLYDHAAYFGHDRALYDEAIMVPVIIRSDAFSTATANLDSLTRSIDIIPTLLGLLDVEVPRAVEGKYLLALKEVPGPWPISHAFCEAFPFAPNGLPQHGVRTMDFKLVWKDVGPDSIEKQLYDLTRDPGEQHNVYATKKTEAARLDSLLTSWIGPDTRHPFHVPTPPNNTYRRLLRRLGYID